MKRTKLKKKSKNPVKALQRECDRAFQIKFIKDHPKSLLSGKPTEVCHHFIHKSASNRLRYEDLNGIPLTNAEHFALHQREGEYSAKILRIKGLEWSERLEKMKQESVKTNKKYYEGILQTLLSLQ